MRQDFIMSLPYSLQRPKGFLIFHRKLGLAFYSNCLQYQTLINEKSEEYFQFACHGFKNFIFKFSLQCLNIFSQTLPAFL